MKKKNSILYSCVIYQRKEIEKKMKNNIIDSNHDAYMAIHRSITKGGASACNITHCLHFRRFDSIEYMSEACEMNIFC